jgi:hypothetical protein
MPRIFPEALTETDIYRAATPLPERVFRSYPNGLSFQQSKGSGTQTKKGSVRVANTIIRLAHQQELLGTIEANGGCEYPATGEIMKKQRTSRSLGTLKAEDGYGIGKLCFATIMGLMAFVAAVFTTTLPLSLGWRYLWLAVCVASFLIGYDRSDSFFSTAGRITRYRITAWR